MSKPLDPMDEKLPADDQATYDRFEDGLNEVKDRLWTLVHDLAGRGPKGRGELGAGLRAMVANDLGLLAEDIHHDLEYEVGGYGTDDDDGDDDFDGGDDDDDDDDDGVYRWIPPMPPGKGRGGRATGKAGRKPVPVVSPRKVKAAKPTRAPAKPKARERHPAPAAGKKPGKGRKR